MTTNTEKLFLQKLGQKIKEIRLAKGITQANFSFACGLHPSYIPRLEVGKINPTITVLVKISFFLEINLDILIDKDIKKTII